MRPHDPSGRRPATRVPVGSTVHIPGVRRRRAMAAALLSALLPLLVAACGDDAPSPGARLAADQPRTAATSADPARTADGADVQATTQTDPCASARTQLELTTCWGDAARQAEARAAAVTDSARARLRSRQDTASLAALDRGLAAWRAFQTTYCGAVESLHTGGSMAPMAGAQCRADLAAQWATLVRRDFLTEGGG